MDAVEGCYLAAFDLARDRLKVAVNDQFTDWSHELLDGDRLVASLPAAGRVDGVVAPGRANPDARLADE